MGVLVSPTELTVFRIFVEVFCLLYRFTLPKGQPGTDLWEPTDEMLENQ